MTTWINMTEYAMEWLKTNYLVVLYVESGTNAPDDSPYSIGINVKMKSFIHIDLWFCLLQHCNCIYILYRILLCLHVGFFLKIFFYICTVFWLSHALSIWKIIFGFESQAMDDVYIFCGWSNDERATRRGDREKHVEYSEMFLWIVDAVYVYGGDVGNCFIVIVREKNEAFGDARNKFSCNAR